jgi:hypothetical protein
MEELKTVGVVVTKYLSFGALCSFITYWHSHLKDRAKLKITNNIYQEYKGDNRGEYRPRSIHIKVVNVGRRATILTGIYFEHDDGSTHGMALGYPNGQKFDENEKWEATFDMESNSSHLYSHEHDTSAVNIYFRDTQDRKYYIKGAKKLLNRFWQKNDEEQKSRRQKLLLLQNPSV